MKTIKNNKIIIATGGTGGHIFPAYSLAKNFTKKDYLVEIITDKRGLKYLGKNNDIKLILKQERIEQKKTPVATWQAQNNAGLKQITYFMAT